MNAGLLFRMRIILTVVFVRLPTARRVTSNLFCSD